MKLFTLLTTAALVGNAIAGYAPDPRPVEPKRAAQLLLSDNSDCVGGGTHGIYDGECFDIQTSNFAISELNGDLVNPDTDCFVMAHEDPECGDGTLMVLQPNVCYPGYPYITAVMAQC